MQDPLNALFQVGPLPETLLHDSKRRIRINLKPIRLIRVFIRASRTLTPITNRKTIRHYRPSILSPWWPTGDPSRVQYESKRLSAKMYGPNVQFKIPCTFLFGRRLWCTVELDSRPSTFGHIVHFRTLIFFKGPPFSSLGTSHLRPDTANQQIELWSGDLFMILTKIGYF